MLFWCWVGFFGFWGDCCLGRGFWCLDIFVYLDCWLVCWLVCGCVWCFNFGLVLDIYIIGCCWLRNRFVVCVFFWVRVNGFGGWFGFCRFFGCFCCVIWYIGNCLGGFFWCCWNICFGGFVWFVFCGLCVFLGFCYIGSWVIWYLGCLLLGCMKSCEIWFDFCCRCFVCLWVFLENRWLVRVEKSVFWNGVFWGVLKLFFLLLGVFCKLWLFSGWCFSFGSEV